MDNKKASNNGSNKNPSKYITKIHNGETVYWNEEYGAWGVFRPYRKNPKTGELEWAKMHGKRAFFIPITEK